MSWPRSTKRRIAPAEAGLKYFLFGSTASAFTLFGLSLIYGMSGTTWSGRDRPENRTVPLPPLLAAGIVMTLIGFAFKIAAAPFHLWAPDAYQGAPIPSAAFIASGSKVASFVVLGKIVLVGFAPVTGSAAWHAMMAGWSPLLQLLAALSILLGNFVALRANECPPAACLLGRRARWLHFARARRRRTRRIFGDAILHNSLRRYARRLHLASSALCGAKTGGDDLQNFAGLIVALAIPRRLHVDLHAFAGRVAAAGRILWEILSL